MRVLRRPMRGHRQLLIGASALLFGIACDNSVDYTPSGPDSSPDSGVFDMPTVTPDAPPPKNYCVICHSDQAMLEAVADPVPPPPEPTGES